MHRLTLYLNLWSLTTYIRIISKDTFVTKSKRRRIVNLMSNYTSSDFSVRKTSTFYNFFPAHCTTIILPTTATTSEATHCRLSDNIPIIMESTMTTTSKTFFSVFAMAPIQFHTHHFFYCLCHNSIEIEKIIIFLTHYNIRHSNCVSKS